MADSTRSKAVVLTAYNRPEYLRQVLESWANVHGIQRWDFIISIDWSEDTHLIEDVVADFYDKIPNLIIITHPKNLGVLKHPLEIMDYLFEEFGYEFIVRAEDDLVVSDGVLEYFEIAKHSFNSVMSIATVHAHSEDEEGELNKVYKEIRFNPWLFGTWKHKWDILRNNWDQDYSTYDTVPGNRSGFDWNFNLRVYPRYVLYGLYPEVSRVKNIGAYGVHGTPELLPPSPTFTMNNEPLRSLTWR